jgi:predicted small lipoprotein YifL
VSVAEAPAGHDRYPVAFENMLAVALVAALIARRHRQPLDLPLGHRTAPDDDHGAILEVKEDRVIRAHVSA